MIGMTKYDLVLSTLGVLSALWSFGVTGYLTISDRVQMRRSMSKLLLSFAALVADLGRRRAKKQ